MSIVRPVTTPFERPVRLGILISGGGTTMDNFQKQIADKSLNAEIALVIASRNDCSGIAKAKAAGLRCVVVPRGSFSDVDTFSDALFNLLREAEVDLVTLAGFLSLVHIPDDFRYRVMNIHPSLIPAFCGQGFFGHKVHEAAVDRGVKVSGCTVHFADNQYDQGPIIFQESVPVFGDDTPDKLAERVFQAECTAYPEAVRLFAAGKLGIEHHRVLVNQ